MAGIMQNPYAMERSNNAGFTTGDPWLKVNPNYMDINVEKDRKDPNSIFHFYKKMIELRKKIRPLFMAAMT